MPADSACCVRCVEAAVPTSLARLPSEFREWGERGGRQLTQPLVNPTQRLSTTFYCPSFHSIGPTVWWTEGKCTAATTKRSATWTTSTPVLFAGRGTNSAKCQLPNPVGGGVLCLVLEDSVATRAILSEAPSCFGDIVVVFVGGSGSSFHSIPRLRLNPSES